MSLLPAQVKSPGCKARAEWTKTSLRPIGGRKKPSGVFAKPAAQRWAAGFYRFLGLPGLERKAWVRGRTS